MIYMSIEFTISFDQSELSVILNSLLNIKDKTIAEERIGYKLDFILENMKRDEEVAKEE